MEWIFEDNRYSLMDEGKKLISCNEGFGIGLCYSKGEMWTVLKHGTPKGMQSYSDDINYKLEKDGVFDSYPDLRYCFVELYPKGEILDLFNHSLQCSGRIKKFLEEEYMEPEVESEDDQDISDTMA